MNKITNDKEQLTEQLLAQMDKVFFYCIKRCNNRIDAEDLSQDILLDIMININKGIKIENFDYYIWQICKNHYSKYVADKLNLPLGTVKYRLFNIKNRLKEYLKMERLNGKKAFVPKEYQTHRSGGANLDPEEYTSGLIQQNLLLHSYGNPCSLEDYAIEMGISLPYIENIEKSLEYATLLIKDQNGKYLTNFIMIDKDIDLKVLKLIKQKSNEYTKLIVEYCKKH